MVKAYLKALLRLQGDMSDLEFCEKTGVSRTQLWRIKTGKSSVGADFIAKILKYYPEETFESLFFIV